MKITLAQINFIVGDIEGNKEKIIAAAQKAKGSSLVVFSELSLCGVPPYNMLSYNDFIDRCEKAIDEIAEKCDNIPLLIGAPVRNTTGKGKPLFNAAIFLHQGKRQIFKKKNVSYSTYFEPADETNILQLGCMKVAVTIGEDLYNIGNDEFLMTNRIDDFEEKPEIIVNLAADRFDYQRAAKRREILRMTALKHEIPLIFVNQVGGNANLIYDGGSMVFGYNGYIVKSLPFFQEEVSTFDCELFISMKKEDEQVIPEKMELIHDALVLGIRDFFHKQGFKKAILGLSGGLDSALVIALAAKALGAENVLGILMPSQFSSDHSVSDAIASAENLGCPYHIVPIKPAFDTFDEMLKPIFKDMPFDVTEENIQARSRGLIVMAISNKFGNILLNTSNKSEAAVGYGTLYGDLCGSLSVIGDIYKTEAFELCRYINRDKEIIPWHTINKPPSAELRPGQQDTDSLPDYPILDAILYQHIECNKSANELIALGYDEALVNKVVRMVYRNDFKRFQIAPVLAVSPKPFAMREMPIVKK
ncbi:MAG: NAD+ synthase [Bacteroidales bacterium]|nr:NAD+ synthase [Bacteroidales bacterium]